MEIDTEWEVILISWLHGELAMWIYWKQSHNGENTWSRTRHMMGDILESLVSIEMVIWLNYMDTAAFQNEDEESKIIGYQHKEEETHHPKNMHNYTPNYCVHVIGYQRMTPRVWCGNWWCKNVRVQVFCRAILVMVGNTYHIITTSSLNMSGSRNPEQK